MRRRNGDIQETVLKIAALRTVKLTRLRRSGALAIGSIEHAHGSVTLAHLVAAIFTGSGRRIAKAPGSRSELLDLQIDMRGGLGVGSSAIGVTQLFEGYQYVLVPFAVGDALDFQDTLQQRFRIGVAFVPGSQIGKG